jgi:predicted AAA+ superfamily ATPase
MAQLDPRSVLEGDKVFEEFKGALTEQYVLQQLLSLSGPRRIPVPYYWSSERSDGEIDFVLQLERGIIPLEVKASENLQAKSLRAYRDAFAPPLCVRTSLAGYRKKEWLVNLPLYAVSLVPHLLDAPL